MVNSAFYRRKLPHWQPAEATFFITFRLFGSIPIPVLRRMSAHFNLVQQGIIERGDLTERERRELLRYETKRQHALADDFLDKNLNAPYWLKQSDIASIVAEAIHFRDERQYELHAYCLMSNHVHILFTLKKDAPVLYKIMQDLKKFTGLHCNRKLNRSGAFWEEEYYDHIVRDQREFERTVRYILQNPVKAGMVSDWQDWTWTYVHRNAVPI